MQIDASLRQEKLECFFPLREDMGWPEGELYRDLSIERMGFPGDLGSTDCFSISQAQRDDLATSTLWLRYAFQCPIGYRSTAYERANSRVSDLASLMFALCPKPPKCTIVFRRSGPLTCADRICTLPEYFQRPIRVPITDFDAPSLDELRDACVRLRDCYDASMIRLIHSVRFLAHGMQAREAHLATLLWSIGLDGMLMAVNEKVFVSRLCRLLGPDSYVFGKGADWGTQPRVLVKEVAKDLYQFRSEIAHGKEISTRFREKRTLESTAKSPIICGDLGDKMEYRAILHSAAMFLLSAGIRAVFTNAELYKEASDKGRWRAYLDG